MPGPLALLGQPRVSRQRDALGTPQLRCDLLDKVVAVLALGRPPLAQDPLEISKPAGVNVDDGIPSGHPIGGVEARTVEA